MRSIEAQADLFAATWAVPPAITTEARQRGPDEVALVDYVLAQRLIRSRPAWARTRHDRAGAQELLVAALDARARVLDRHYPEDASAWKRLIWALSHRGSLLQELESGTVTQFISSLDPERRGRVTSRALLFAPDAGQRARQTRWKLRLFVASHSMQFTKPRIANSGNHSSLLATRCFKLLHTDCSCCWFQNC